MHRFFLAPERCQEAKLSLRDTEAHHAVRVLRIEPGEEIVVLDGRGKHYRCRVISATKSFVELSRISAMAAPMASFSTTLIAAIPKAQVFDEITEQATELGVTRLIPLMTERGNVRLDAKTAQAKQRKWQITAMEALKQCGGYWLPTIDLPVTFGQLMARFPSSDLSLVAALTASTSEVRSTVQRYMEAERKVPKSVSIWIGPEGDFTPAELDQLATAGGQLIQLGPQVLRCATAAVAAVSLVSHELRTAAANPAS